jgi:hypothetical protein
MTTMLPCTMYCIWYNQKSLNKLTKEAFVETELRMLELVRSSISFLLFKGKLNLCFFNKLFFFFETFITLITAKFYSHQRLKEVFHYIQITNF